MGKDKLLELQYLLHLFTLELPVEKQRELSKQIKAINKEINELINLLNNKAL